MPTIVTRGAASARGAGTFSAAPPPPPPPPPSPTPPPPPPPGPAPVYQTATFTSSGTWTAPAGVTYLVTLEVAGGLYFDDPGYFAYDNTGAIYAARYVPSYDQAGSPTGLSYNNVTTYAGLVLSSFNSGGTGDRVVTYEPLAVSWNPSTGGYFDYLEGAVTLRINGVAERLLGPWDNRSNTPVGGPSQPPTEWSIGVQVFVPGSSGPGSPSSAFGYTAAGTTSAGQAQIKVNATYVPVTPGQTYNITVGGASGYVTLQFLQS